MKEDGTYYFIEKFKNMIINQGILDKWISIGFLEDINDNDRIFLAFALEEMAKILLKDMEKDVRVFSEFVDTMGFVVLVGAVRENYRCILEKEEVYQFLVDFNDYLNTPENREFLHDYGQQEGVNRIGGIDAEAELMATYRDKLVAEA